MSFDSSGLINLEQLVLGSGALMAYLLSCQVCAFSASSSFVGAHASLFISTDSCFCLSCLTLTLTRLLKNTRQPVKDKLVDEFLLTPDHIYH